MVAQHSCNSSCRRHFVVRGLGRVAFQPVSALGKSLVDSSVAFEFVGALGTSLVEAGGGILRTSF